MEHKPCFPPLCCLLLCSIPFALISKLGYSQTLGDQEETAYSALHLWASAAKKAGSFDSTVINKILREHYCCATPSGPLFVDAKTLYTWKQVLIETFDDDAKIKTVWRSPKLVTPNPFPQLYTQEAWLTLVADTMKHYAIIERGY